MQVSYAPTGYLDYAATVMNAVNGSTAYGPTVFDIEEDASRKRYYWMTTSEGYGDIYLKEYEIDGDVLDFNNWRLTGRVIDVEGR